MTLLLNDDDMNRMLEEIRPEGEQYIGKAWGTITGGTARILSLGALSNVSCYVGVTDRSLVIAVMGTFDITQVSRGLCIPFDRIEQVKIRQGLLPSQKMIRLKTEGKSLKLSLIHNPVTARVKNQKEGIQKICEALAEPAGFGTPGLNPR